MVASAIAKSRFPLLESKKTQKILLNGRWRRLTFPTVAGQKELEIEKNSTQKLTSSVFAIRKCVAMVPHLCFLSLKLFKKQFTQKLANETKIKIAVLFLVLGPGWSFQNATPISGSRRPLEKCGRSAGRKRTDRAGGNRARERGRRAKKPNSRDTTMTRTQRRGARVCVS